MSCRDGATRGSSPQGFAAGLDAAAEPVLPGEVLPRIHREAASGMVCGLPSPNPPASARALAKRGPAVPLVSRPRGITDRRSAAWPSATEDSSSTKVRSQKATKRERLPDGPRLLLRLVRQSTRVPAPNGDPPERGSSRPERGVPRLPARALATDQGQARTFATSGTREHTTRRSRCDKLRCEARPGTQQRAIEAELASGKPASGVAQRATRGASREATTNERAERREAQAVPTAPSARLFRTESQVRGPRVVAV